MYIKEVSLQGFRNLDPFIFVPWDALSGAEASSSLSPLGRKKAISAWKSCGKTGVTASMYT